MVFRMKSKEKASIPRRSLGRPDCESWTVLIATVSVNLLGSDLRITNFGEEHKFQIEERDRSTESATVLWIKGSGGDIGSIQKKGSRPYI